MRHSSSGTPTAGAACRAIWGNWVRPSSRAAANAWRAPSNSTPGRRRPQSEDKRQPRPAAPLFARSRNSNFRPAGRNPAVADEHHGVGRALRRGPHRKRPQRGPQTQMLAEPYLHQGRAGARSFVQRQAADPFQGNAAVEHDAPHWAVAGDAAVGDDRAARVAKIFDRGNQGNVEAAFGQAFGQPAGQVHLDRGLRRQSRKAERQRPSVEIADRAIRSLSGTGASLWGKYRLYRF